MSASLTITGGDALRGRLTGLVAAAHQAIAAALFQEGEAIIAAAKERTPVDTGALKSSGYVEPPVQDGNTTRVTLGFGGAASAYAAAVHERLHDHHPSGGPKYLESVINEAEAGFGSRIGARVAAELGL